MRRSLFFLCVFFTLTLSAQHVSVELTIEWEKELDFDFREVDTINIKPAFLKITYRNLSDSAIYFSKFSGSRHKFPRFLILDAVSYSQVLTLYDLFLTYNNFSDLDFNVAIGSAFNYKIVFDLWSITEPSNPSSISSSINDSLRRIYNYLYEEYMSEDKKREDTRFHLKPLDISEKMIENKWEDVFVYLNGNESFTERFYLIGFQLTGGNFTFKIPNRKSPNIISLGFEWEEDEPLKKFRELPKVIDGYKLYEGTFLTNEVSVSFPGVRLPAQIKRKEEK